MPLVLVPTPLGNLRDITLRALDVLQAADTIVAEDTRVARRLLSALEIPAPEIVHYDEHSARSTLDSIVTRAKEERVAVVTDAGTPGISDPGIELVRHARAAGVRVEVLPGPTAFVVAAVLSGFALERFAFEGFLPRTRRERRDAFTRALRSGIVTVWYEAPHRIAASLTELAELAPRTPIFLARELTKLHEQQARGTASEVLAALEKPVRGEIVLVLPPSTIDVGVEPAAPTLDELDDAIDAALAAGSSIAAIAKSLAGKGLGERRELYARASARKRAKGRP
ncbi:MAG: 16S rRNA (cytidine(1402)-2'-O)-methyltransferase [Candidatus Eremiobacteraeota bacterium]|nr:16S rRNA (cytidine(1402)-2'-O)-methyltransferase [Candidatus Eremiobacteraeota bacterium]